MATVTERVTALVQAMQNEIPTAQDINNIADLCIANHKAEILGLIQQQTADYNDDPVNNDPPWDINNLNNDQKARIILDCIWKILRNTFRNTKRGDVLETNNAAIMSAGQELDEINP